MTNQKTFETSQASNEAAADFQQQVENFRLSDEDLIEETNPGDTVGSSPGVKTPPSLLRSTEPKPYKFVPLTMGGNGRTHVVSKESRSLIEEEVTLADLEKMTALFYDRVFQDPTLDQFIRSHDDPHGSRFAKWIHQKLSGSNVWDHDRQTRDLKPVTLAGGHRHVIHDRTSAHAAAWYSPKRPSQQVGRHFELDECRVWMRLHFWAMRESGLLEKSPSFSDYYVRFIGHFVRVYESTAPNFARDSFRWSADPANIAAYIQNGRRMSDVLDLSLDEAQGQIPYSEANDFAWPYNKTEPKQ